MEYTPHDARLDRRLRRRRIFDRNFQHDNSANLRKRIACDDSQNDYAITRDYDYEMFLDHFIQHGDPVDTGVPIVVDEPFLCENTDDVEVDPDYMILCEGLREVGTSYVLEVATGNEKIVVEYETEELFDDHPVSFAKSNNIKKRINAEPSKISWSSSSERTKEVDKSYIKYLEILEISLNGRENMVYTPCNTKLASDYEAGSCDMAEREDKSSSSERVKEKSSSSERVKETSEPYMKLLNYYGTNQKELDSLVACNTKYASDSDASSCDSEVIMLDFDPSASGILSPFMTSKSVVIAVDEDSGSCLQSHCTSPSARFRAALLKDLKKPFNQAEYEFLLEEVSCRKEIIAHREFRSGTKSYKRESIGKSYLDIYGDLAAKINQVRSDHHRVLYILRGFFFWLKNLTREGSFPPWLDPFCMETLPLSK